MRPKGSSENDMVAMPRGGIIVTFSMDLRSLNLVRKMQIVPFNGLLTHLVF